MHAETGGSFEGGIIALFMVITDDLFAEGSGREICPGG
jgi:hypothetical protein